MDVLRTEEACVLYFRQHLNLQHNNLQYCANILSNDTKMAREKYALTEYFLKEVDF